MSKTVSYPSTAQSQTYVSLYCLLSLKASSQPDQTTLTFQKVHRPASDLSSLGLKLKLASMLSSLAECFEFAARSFSLVSVSSQACS
jgi:hypothetical protein